MSENQTPPSADGPHGADPEPISEFDQVRAEENLPDVDAEAAQLHQDATERLTRDAQADREVGFGRQMLQLTVIPALIVAGIMGVWMLITVLGGQAQSLDSLLTQLESAPDRRAGDTSGGSGGTPAEGTGSDGVAETWMSVAGRPGYQERQRAVLNLFDLLENKQELSDEERADAVQRLTVLADRQLGGDEKIGRFILGSLSLLSDPSTLDTFETWLTSANESDQYAAVVSLNRWRGQAGDLRPLVPAIVGCLDASDVRVTTLASLLLGGAADPADVMVRAALVTVMNAPDPARRDASWNAGCALAALGDDRGLPVLKSLLDREWLAQQVSDPANANAGVMSTASQDKIIKTVLNVVVGYDPDTDSHFVRVSDQGVWDLIRDISEQDSSSDVREYARKVLEVRAGSDGG
ncbi:MAG: hypothetical protein D8M59_06650 [Planctomycetes bacterium]|nr:hypothetical protein [Planctomycetota bacterium]NOG55177.1 hypothetical protein [Planctomycetota bacterium]